MSALLLAYDEAAEFGTEPDSTLISYMTNQLTAGRGEIPEPIWGLLSGFGSLTYMLLDNVAQLNAELGGGRPATTQAVLDHYAEISAQVVANAFGAADL